MKAKKLIAAVLAALTAVCSVPMTANAAAAASVVDLEGERTAFVSSFGRINYDGKNYTAYKTLDEAFSALGKDGGKVIFAGTLDMSKFKDIEGRKEIVFEGVGTKSSGNLLDFAGTKDEPVMESSISGDVVYDFMNIRLAEGAFLFTNGYNFSTRNEFDTYHKEIYVEGASNKIEYTNPPSIAPGKTNGNVGIVSLSAGTYSTIAAGAVNKNTVNSDTVVKIKGGTIETAVGANFGEGSVMNGNANLTIESGSIGSLIAGSAAGTVNGNVNVTLNGGNIREAVIGAEKGATINGSVVVALNGGTYGGTIKAGAGKVTGKKIVITGADAVADVDKNAYDYLIKATGCRIEPQFDGANVKNFLITDQYGIPIKKATINGKELTSENSIFNLDPGVTTITAKTDVKVAINKNAKYVAGYEDGTFGAQNNMTKAEAVTLLTRLIIDENAIKGKISASFKDVEDGAWYDSYIAIFEKLGFLELVSEQGGTIFKPNDKITRAQFTQLLYEISAFDSGSSSMKLRSFSDVKSTNVYKAAIFFAVSNGIVLGYDDGTFKPDNLITRAEVVTMVNRFIGRVPTGKAGASSFKDIEGHWAKDQILAACNDEGTSWTAKQKSEGYKLTGKSAKDYVIGLYEQSADLTADEIREGVDKISEQLKKDILNTPNTEEIYGDLITGQKYYVSELHGDDANDGKTPETAFKTIAGLTKGMKFPKKGTAILFERGGVYRGQMSMTTGLVYGSYGTGNKPIIMQSKKNYASPALWEEVKDYPNVYKYKGTLNNVGVMAFDHNIQDYSDATYKEKYGIIMNYRLQNFMGIADLANDLEFYSIVDSDRSGGVQPNELYLYSTEGNPGSRFKSIEIGENTAIFTGAGNDVVIDNISFKFTGGHGMGGAGGCKNRTVTNCVYSWLGGSILSLDFHGNGKPVNYGNAVEIYGSCNGYHVENNWMYQIYDTAVTHQYSDPTRCTQEGVRYYGNLMEYCHWGIEFYNATGDSTTNSKNKYTKDVHHAYNVLRLSGYGWGSIVRYRKGLMYCGSSLSYNEDELTEYNIFDRCYGNMITLPSNSNEKDDKNFYIQTLGQPLGSLKGSYVYCDFDSAEKIASCLGDKNAVVIVIDPEKEPLVLDKPQSILNRS